MWEHLLIGLATIIPLSKMATESKWEDKQAISGKGMPSLFPQLAPLPSDSCCHPALNDVKCQARKGGYVGKFWL